MTTYQNIHIRNHTARRTSRNTARITVESCSFIDSGRKPEIWRFYLTKSGLPEMHKGAILGKETGKPCALSIIASRRDLICVRQKLAGIDDHQWDYYRIGTFYELISMDLPNRCLSRGEIRKHLENTDLREPHQLEFSENDLQRFFSQRHPEWLSEIASRKLEHWKRYKPGKYYLFDAIEAVEIPLCIRVVKWSASRDRVQLTEQHNNNTHQMKNTLKPGLHVAIVTSPKPGYGGSMLAWETYEVCKRLGIPAIFVTFDRFRPYPPNIKADLRRLPVSESPVAMEEEVASCLISIVKEARDEGKFLIIDTQAGHYPHHPMFAAFIRAELAKADSIAALVAVFSGIDKSRDPFSESGITFDRTIFRCWGFRSEFSRISSDDKTHRWIPRFLSRNAVIEINEGSSMNSATVMHDSGNGVRLDEHSGYSDEVVAHLDDATNHIFPTLLKPIIDTAPEGGAAAF